MIKLRALGAPSIVGPDGSAFDDLTRQAKRFGLLLYLACEEGRTFHREDLLAVFWPESDAASARNCLRQSLHFLRTQLGDEALLGCGDQEVGLERGRLVTDVEVFRRALATGSPEAALELYRGDFLSGFHLRDLPPFESWLERRRAEFRSLTVGASKQLAHTAEGLEDICGALHWWKRTAALTPFDESVARRIAALQIHAGNRGEAIEVLTRFAGLLRAELEVEPSEETLALLRCARNGSVPENLPSWFGDRRRTRPGGNVAPWRRATDSLSI
jgi:DNA-binding SARP family transcriptional activator